MTTNGNTFPYYYNIFNFYYFQRKFKSDWFRMVNKKSRIIKETLKDSNNPELFL